MNTTTKVILGVTLAAATGAAIGMLLAPEKGSDLQKKIKDNSKDWLNAFFTILNTGKEIASQMTEREELAYEGASNSEVNNRREF
jgi:gas vesicle protein